MALSYELISQFAKQLAKPDKKTNTESTVYGTVVVDAHGDKYVKLDGSDQLTPLTDASANVNKDERVSVLIKNHTAVVTGNISSPAARTGDVENLEDQVTEIKKFDIVLAETVQANEALIKKLDADKANVGDLNAAAAKITELEAGKASIDELNAAKAEITDLKSTKIDAEVVNAKFVKVDESLEAVNADIYNLEAEHAEFKKATVEDLDAQNAEINNLKAKDAEIDELIAKKASVEDLNATNAEVANLKAKDAEIEELVAKKASVEDLNATNATITNLGSKYATIDFSNIGEAAIRKIFSDTGIIKDLVVGDGTITGELVGVTIKGDLIEGNTVKADKLVVKGSDGLYYKLNFEAGTFVDGEVVPDDSIHGSVITAKSITAEKVSVHDLVAFGATIGGFHIRGRDEEIPGAIYSGVKESVHASVPGVYLDDDGQMSIGDANNYVKFYKDETGNYKLAISLVDNLKIGGRNLIRNSSTLIFEDYGFGLTSYDVTANVTDDVVNVTDNASMFAAEVIDGVLYMNEQLDTMVNAKIQNGVLTVY